MHARPFLRAGPLRQALQALPGGPARGHAFGSQGLAAGVRSGVCEGDRVGVLEVAFAGPLEPSRRAWQTDRLLRDRGHAKTNPIVSNRKESIG